MIDDFDPSMEPEINIPVWLKLIDLRSSLWNTRALNKIASSIGKPIEVDYRTLHRENFDGPRMQVIVNTAKKPKESINLRLHTGEVYEVKIAYEFMPKFCVKCRYYGHLEEACTGSNDQPPIRMGPINNIMPNHQGRVPYATNGRQQQKNARNVSIPRQAAARPNTGPNQNNRHRSVSRPKGQQRSPSRTGRSRSKSVVNKQWQPKGNTEARIPLDQQWKQQTFPIVIPNAELAKARNEAKAEKVRKERESAKEIARDKAENVILSPNKFALLNEESEEIEQGVEQEQEKLQADIDEALDKMVDNLVGEKRAVNDDLSFVNTKKRSKSRPPKHHEGRPQEEEGARNEEQKEDGNPVDLSSEKDDIPVKEQAETKKKKKKSKEVENPEEEEDAQNIEEDQRIGREEKRKKDGQKKHRSKSKAAHRSRSRVPENWEDGVDKTDDVAQ